METGRNGIDFSLLILVVELKKILEYLKKWPATELAFRTDVVEFLVDVASGNKAQDNDIAN